MGNRGLKGIFNVFAYVLLTFFSAWPATAESLINIAAEENVFPYSFTENGEPRGIDYDIVVEAGKRMPIHYEIRFAPWKRMMYSLEKGICDAGFGLFYKKERESSVIFTKTPLHHSSYSIFVKKGKEFKFESIKDLYGKTVGNIRGYKVNEEFDKAVNDGKIRVEEVTEVIQNAKKLEFERVDCAVAHHDLMLYTLKSNGLADKIVELPKPVETNKPVYLVFSRIGKNIDDKEAFVKRFDAVLENMRNDGTFQKIYDKYLK